MIVGEETTDTYPGRPSPAIGHLHSDATVLAGMIPKGPAVSTGRRCINCLRLSTSVDRKPKASDPEGLALLRRIDEHDLATPF
jgi:hypothetical protein